MRTYNPGLRIRPPIRTRGILGGRGAGRGDGSQAGANTGWSLNDSFNYNETKVDYGALQRRETEIRDSYASKTDLSSNADSNRHSSPSPLRSRDRARSRSRYRSKSGSRSPRRRSRSRSRSPGPMFRRRSRSRTPGYPRRRSRSRTPGVVRRRSRSRTPGSSRTPGPVRRRSRSPTSGKRRSRSPPSRRRSRSPPSGRRRSRTRSPARRRSRSPDANRARSPKRQERPPTSQRPKSRSRSPEGRKRAEDTTSKNESSRIPTTVLERGREVIQSNSPALDKNIRVTVGNYSFEDKASASKISPLIEKRQGYKKENPAKPSLYGDSPIVKHSDHSPSPQLPSRISREPRKAPEFDMFYDETRDIRLRLDDEASSAHKFQKNPFAEIGAEKPTASKESRRDVSSERISRLPSHSPSPQPLEFMQREFKPPPWAESPTRGLHDSLGDGKQTKSILKKPSHRFADEDSSSRSGTLSGVQGYSFETAGKSLESITSTIIPGLGDLQGVEDEERFLYGDDADEEPNKSSASGSILKAAKKGDADRGSESGSPVRRKSTLQESPYKGLFKDSWEGSETRLSRERSPYRGFRQKSPPREKSPPSRLTSDFSPVRNRQGYSPPRGREMSPFRSRKDNFQFNEEFSLRSEERKQESSQFGDIFASLLRNRDAPNLLDPSLSSVEQDILKPASRSLEDVLTSLGFDFDMVRKFKEKAKPPEKAPSPEKDVAAEAVELYGIQPDMQVSSFFDDKDSFHKKANLGSSLSQNDAKPLEQWPGQYEHASAHQYHGHPPPVPDYPHMPFPVPPNYQTYPYGPDYYQYPPPGPFHGNYEGQPSFQNPPPFQNSAPFQGPPQFQGPPPIVNPVNPQLERPNLLVVPLQKDNSQTNTVSKNTSVQAPKPIKSDTVSSSKQREMASPAQAPGIKSALPSASELSKSQTQVLESKQSDALVIAVGRDEKIKRLHMLRKILERLRKEQGELMRKKQKQKDGHKDPLLLENSKLQEDILSQITSLHTAVAVEGEVLGKILTPYKVNVTEPTAPVLQQVPQHEKQVSKLEITVTPEVPKVASTNDAVECYYYDAGNHWCKQCNETFQNLKKLFQHLQSPDHLKNMDPAERPWKTDPNKQAAEQNKTKKGLYTAVKGSQFMVPCNILYCSLCKVFVGDELAAESHVKTKDHNVTYLSYVMEDNDYERSWDQTKAAALISKHKERKRRMLEEQEERDRKRRKAEEEEAKDKEKKRSNAMKKNQELIKAEAARNQPVDELDEASSSAAPSHKEPADLPKVKGKEIRLKLKEEKSSSVKDSSNVQTAEQPKSQDTGFGKFTWKKDNDSKTTEGPVDSKEDQVDADSKSQKIGSKIAIRLSGKTVIPPSIPWQTVPKSQGNKTSTIAPQISKKLPFVFPLRKTKLEPSKSSVPEQRTVAADYFGLAKDSCEPPPARVAANQKGASGFAPTHSDIANAFGGVFESSLKESNNVSPPGLQNIPLPSHDSNVNDGISSLKDVSNVAKDYKAEGDSIIVTKGMSAIVPKIPGADKVGSTGRLRESSLVVYGPTLPEGYVSMPPEGTNLSQFLSNPNLVSDNKNPHQSLPKVQDIKKTTVRKSYGPFLPENYDCRPPGEDPVYLVPSEKTKIEKTCSVSTNSNLSGSVSSSNAGGTLVTGTSQFKKPEVKSIASAAGSRPTVPKKTPAVVGINLNKSVGNRPKMQAVNKPTSPNKKVAPVKAPIAVKNVRPVSSPTTNKNTVNQPTTAKLLQGSVKVPAAEGTHNLASSVGATKLPKLLPHKVAPNVEESKKEMPTDDKKEMATKPDFSESAASKLENTGNKEMQSETSDVVEPASKMEVNEEYINKKITHSDESSDPKGTDGVDAVKAQTLADCVVADGNSTEKLVQSSSTGETFAMEKDNSSVSEQNATLLRLDLVKGSGETKTAEATGNMSFCAKTIHLSQEEDSKLGLVPSETDGLNNLSEGVSTARTKELTDTEVPESTVESSMAVAAVVPKDGITSCSDQIPAASNVTSVVSSKLDEKHKISSAPCTDEEKDKVQKPLIISVGGNTKNKNVQEMEKELMATNTPGVTADSIHITEAVDMTGQSFESSISDKKSNLPGEDTPTKAVSQNVEDEASKCVDIAVGEDSKLVESFSCVDSEKHKLEKTMLARKTKSQAELHTEKKEVPTKAVVENPIKTEEAGTSINVGIPSTVSVSKDAGKMKTEEKTVEQATDAEVTAKRKTSNSGPKPLRTTAVRAASKLQKRESQTAKNRSTNTDEHKETVCVDCSVVLTDILQCGPKGNTAACTNVITSEKTTVLGKREVNKESCVQDEVICNVGDNQVGKNELDEDQIDGEVQQNKRKRLEKDSPINTEQVHSAMCAGSENLDEHNSKKTTKICDSTCEAEINTNTCVAPVSERCMPLLTVETRATKRVFENSETFDNSNLAEDSSVEQLTKKLCQEISNIEASSAPPTLEKEVTAISDGLTNNKASDNSTLAPELEAMPSAARIENNVTLPVNSEVADKEIGNLGGTPDVTNACISALHDAAVSVAAVLESVASDGVSATAEEARSADGQMKPDSKRDGQEDSNSARGFTSDAESVVTDYNVNAGNDLVVLDETLYDTE